MPVMDYIDISSSDDDLESWETDGRGSADPRVLPQWASTRGPNSSSTSETNPVNSENFWVSYLILYINQSFFKFAGYSVQSQKVASPKRAYASNGSSSNVDTYLVPGSSDNNRVPNQHIAEVDGSEYSTVNGNASDSWTVNSRIANLSGADYERISSQQALKRTLPPSLLPSALSTRLNNFVENVGSSQVRDAYGNSYHSAGPSVSNSKGHLRDQFSRGKNGEVMMYENSGSRILPPSLMHGKAISSNQFASTSDPLYRSMVGEDRNAGNDERLIYQAALEVSATIYYRIIQF